jgi:hypothetical protein
VSRRRVQGTACAVCGRRVQAISRVELCYHSDGVWVWCHAKLCRACRVAVVSMFAPRGKTTGALEGVR